MANFNNIKHEIDQNVNTNGVQAITGAILNETLKDMIDEVDDKKQDTLVAGSGIAINGNVISATGGSGQAYSAGNGINIDSSNVISVDASDLDGAGLTIDEFGNLAVDTSTIQPKLSAGANITISGNTISATDTNTTYSAGSGLNLNGTTFSVDTTTIQEKLGEGDAIDIDGSNNINVLYGSGLQIGSGGALEVDTQTIQPKLTAGSGISISAQNVISATGGGGGASLGDGDAIHIDSNDNINVLYANGLQLDQNGALEIDPGVVATLGDLSSYLPLSGGTLQDASDTELTVIDGNSEDYVKLVAPETAGVQPHVEIFENGSGDTKFFYDHIERGSQVSIDLPSSSGTIALTSDLAGYLPLTGGNLQSNYLTTELRVKSPDNDSYVYLNSTDTASPEIKFYNNITNPSNGEVHELKIKEERIDIERWDQSGNTWMADTLYFPQFKTGTIALDTDLAGKQDTLTAGTGITIQNNVISATGGSGLWTSGTGNDSLVGPDGGTSSGSGSISLNGSATATNSTAMAGGWRSSASGWNGFAYGNQASQSGDASISLGDHTNANIASGIALGLYAQTGNKQAGSVALGKYNYVDTGSTATQNTTFSIGNGTGSNARSNALELTAGDKFYMTGVGSYTGANASSSTSVQDVINGKQDTLVSGTNIKTINGNSILGSGNLVISGGGGNYLPLTGGTLQEAQGNASTNLITTSPRTYATAAIVTVDLDPGNTAESKAELTLSDYDSSGNGYQATYTSTGISDSVYTLSFPTLSQNETIATVSDLSGKQDTLTAGTGITIQNNVISATGGGGSGLWSSGTGTNSLLSPAASANSGIASGTGAISMGPDSEASGNYSLAFGTDSIASGANSIALGDNAQATGDHAIYLGHNTVVGGAQGDYSVGMQGGVPQGDYSLAFGSGSEAGTTAHSYSIALGHDAKARRENAVAIGHDVSVSSDEEVAIGRHNKSGDYTSGTSTKPAFTIGNGTGTYLGNGQYDNSNSFEIKQNNDAYLYGVGSYDGKNGGSNGVSSLQSVINGKQDALTAGTGISISGNVISATGGGGSYTAGNGIDITSGTISVDTTYLDGLYVPITGGYVCDDISQPQTSFDVWSPDQMGYGYIHSYSEDSSDPNNVIPANAEIGIMGSVPSNADETYEVYHRSNGTIQVGYTTDNQGNTDSVEFAFPQKPSGQTYTLATLDDIQGGGSYLPLTGGTLQDTTVGATETLLDVQAPDSTGALSFSADTLAAMIQMSADRDDANVADGTTYGINFDNSGDVDILVKAVNPLDPTDISTTTYTQTFQQKSGTIALLSDISGGGSSYTAGAGISIDANNEISSTTFVPGTGQNSVKSPTATSASATNALAIGNQASALGVSSVAIGQSSNTSAGNSIALGLGAYARNSGEIALGENNLPTDSGTTAQKTKFTVGNGSWISNTRSNLIEAKQNNDIYVVGVGGFDGTNAGASGVHTLQYAIANAGGGGSSLWTSGTGTDSLVAPATITAGLAVDPAPGTGAISCGYDTDANGDYSFAQGGASEADGDYSFAANNGTAGGDYSAAFGTSGASGERSFAAGDGSTAGAAYSIALGGGNVVYDDSDPDNIIDAQYGIAIGHGAQSLGQYATAFGTAASATGNSSIGLGSNCSAEGAESLAMPYAFSVGDYSLAGGAGSTANAYGSIAIGHGAITYDGYADPTDPTDPNAFETALGKYNYTEADIAFSIGCGYEDNTDPNFPQEVRQNAITITNDGKIYLKGLGGYTGTSVSGCTDLVSFLNNL